MRTEAAAHAAAAARIKPNRTAASVSGTKSDASRSAGLAAAAGITRVMRMQREEDILEIAFEGLTFCEWAPNTL